MNFIDFTEEDKVNQSSIDDQHKCMAEIINSIYYRVIAADKKSILNHLNKFLEIIKTHFEDEERLMKDNSFPGYISHKLEHDRFYRQVLLTTDRFSKGDENVGLEQLKGIKRWFFNHIEINDKKLGKFLAEKGISG
ncbi:MAG: bacteriohemerythrin [Bacteroidota bacterium]